MRTLDWRGLMRAGLRDLGLTPAEFWQLTPADLLIMLGLDGGPPALNRARLEELAAAWPDGPGPGIAPAAPGAGPSAPSDPTHSTEVSDE
ncbi:phage tail assembly chaperone [Plastorhodobacter daqingensis]|uniref:Phage tail assembly chaperone n=1 Tax=Plastorhodobacter daqingensis TaxID=1387281 RepID=A0ABW2UN76_9RHOB